MKFSVENDPDWVSKCSIEPRGENFLVKTQAAFIASFLTADHPLYSKIRDEYVSREVMKKMREWRYPESLFDPLPESEKK